MRGFCRSIAMTAVCVAAFGGMTAASPELGSAAEWRLQAHIAGERYRPDLPLLGISCPSASFCVAVGELDTIVSTTDPTGGASAWHLAKPLGEANTECHEHWSPPCRNPLDRRIRGVSCPSVQLCVAVTGEGYLYSSTNPTGSGDDWRVADIDGDGRDTHLLDVSCPTVSLCVAVSGESYTSGKVLTATDPTSGASAWTVTQLDETLDLRGVSCGTPTLCVAVAQGGRLLVSTNPTGGASAWTDEGTPGGPGHLQAISCATTVLCVAGNAGGNLLTSTSPGVATSWREASGGSSVQVTDASCLPSRQCVAVNNNGDAITSADPTSGGSSWWRTKLIPYVQPATELDKPLNGLFGVSCPTIAFCALVGADGQIFTNTDPFAEPPAPSKRSGRGKKVKRPRVTIAKLIFPSLRAVREGRIRMIARFHANARVRRFECRIGGRRFRRCHSPHRFRVGKGTFALRVRAVGTTGLRGPTATKRFWVGRRCTGHQCHEGGAVIEPKQQR